MTVIPPARPLTFLAALATTLTLALPAAAQKRPTDPVTWTTVGSSAAPSLLAVPAHCQQFSCALIVVSHPRAQTPERLRDSPEFTRLRDTLLAGNFAMLLSSDGGPTTWGSPQGLKHAGKAHQQARQAFTWNGRTYALGISMGGLMALRSTLPGGPYAVSGVALIDPWVNLVAAWHSAPSRQQEIREAYGPAADLKLIEEQDPLHLALQLPPLPMVLTSSLDDKVVSPLQNSELLAGHGDVTFSQHVRLTGPHLGGNRFTLQMGETLRTFFERLEQQAEVLVRRPGR